MGRSCGTHGRDAECIQDFDGKPDGYRQLDRPTSRWEDNINMDLRGTEWGGMDWSHLAQDRDQWKALVNTVMNLRVP
jgi:hypothetical protein